MDDAWEKNRAEAWTRIERRREEAVASLRRLAHATVPAVVEVCQREVLYQAQQLVAAETEFANLSGLYFLAGPDAGADSTSDSGAS